MGMQWQGPGRGFPPNGTADVFLARATVADAVTVGGGGVGQNLKGAIVSFALSGFVQGPGIDVVLPDATVSLEIQRGQAMCPAGVIMDDVIGRAGEKISGRWINVLMFGFAPRVLFQGTAGLTNLTSVFTVPGVPFARGVNITDLQSLRLLRGQVSLTGGADTLNLAGTPGLTWSVAPGYSPMDAAVAGQPTAENGYLGFTFLEDRFIPSDIPTDLTNGADCARRCFIKTMGSTLGRL